MPVNISVGKTDTYSIVGKSKSGKVGITLLANQVVTVTSADPATVIITPDPSPLPTPQDFVLADGTAVPAGNPNQQSGVISGPAAPAQLNPPINVTLHLANTDGTPVLNNEGQPIAALTDTVPFVPAPAFPAAEG